MLDDGWQQISGDWNADPARYPDPSFKAVREAIAPMKLGLWMSAMHFHPTSVTAREHPEWWCQPVAAGLYAYNTAEPSDGSNEAGIVPWGPAAIPYIEGRIRKAITEWGVTYFKFDFLAWLDCAGQGDFHAFRDAFVAMLDRLRADHPAVTLQIDETNDYRLFPFASTTRGPTWFQNGNPEPDVLLHNLWNLAPYVPAYAIGQHVLGGDAWKRHPVSTLMAAALPSHISYFTDIRTLPDDVIDEAGVWIDWYKANRSLFTDGVTYPLLGDPLEHGLDRAAVVEPRAAARARCSRSARTARRRRARIALRNVPDGRTFASRARPTAPWLGTVTSAQLREGIRVADPGAGRRARDRDQAGCVGPASQARDRLVAPRVAGGERLDPLDRAGGIDREHGVDHRLPLGARRVGARPALAPSRHARRDRLDAVDLAADARARVEDAVEVGEHLVAARERAAVGWYSSTTSGASVAMTASQSRGLERRDVRGVATRRGRRGASKQLARRRLVVDRVEVEPPAGGRRHRPGRGRSPRPPARSPSGVVPFGSSANSAIRRPAVGDRSRRPALARRRSARPRRSAEEGVGSLGAAPNPSGRWSTDDRVVGVKRAQGVPVAGVERGHEALAGRGRPTALRRRSSL